MIRLLILLVCIVLPLSVSAQEIVDLFIWAGQSNAQGYTGEATGYPVDTEGLDKDIRLNYTVFGQESSNGEWISMQPQKGRYPSGHFGPEVTFARKLKKAGLNPAIFKYTLGGTGLARDWKAPGEGGIYDAMVSNLKTAIKKLEESGHTVTIQGFIWIQGESDALDDKTANEYENNLSKLIMHLRSEVVKQDDLTVILGVDEQHYLVVERPIVLEAQKNIAQRDVNTIFTTMHGLPKADRTHLTPSGLVEHGHRIYEAYKIVANTKQFSSLKPNALDTRKYLSNALESSIPFIPIIERSTRSASYLTRARPDVIEQRVLNGQESF
jgi:hypothetical protein